jgi:hypothetical protein
MGLFDRFKSNKATALPKGAHLLTVKSVQALSPEAVQIQFTVPTELSQQFKFQAGQYLTLALDINGEQLRRSYSKQLLMERPPIICKKSAPEPKWWCLNPKVSLSGNPNTKK